MYSHYTALIFLRLLSSSEMCDGSRREKNTTFQVIFQAGIAIKFNNSALINTKWQVQSVKCPLSQYLLLNWEWFWLDSSFYEYSNTWVRNMS